MKLVESVNEVIINSKEFNLLKKGDKSHALHRFSQFYHWYYFSDLDIFAPSKFIGYKNTNIDSYNGAGHGGETKKALLKWFVPVNKSSSEFSILKEKLIKYGDSLKKSISKKTFSGTGEIYLLKGEYSTSDYPDEVEEGDYTEGNVKKILVNAYERDTKARNRCISHYGIACYVCGFDFAKVYGKKLGMGFIHVHHIVEISSIGGKYKVNPIKDLRPLCPNCHAMVHKRKPALHPDKLRKMLKKRLKK